MTPAQNTKLNTAKLLNLDIVRAIAVVMIALVHLELFGWGGHGVELFLILTGYTAYLSIDRHSDVKAVTYYKRRLSRILPTYYGAVLIYFFIYLVILKEQYSASEIGLSLLRYFTLTTTIFPRGLIFWFYLGTTGTIVSLMIFYLLAPLLYKFVNNFRKSLVAIVVAYVVCHVWIKYLEIIYTGTSYAGRHPVYTIYFAFFGVAAYFAVKEKKKMEYIIFLSIMEIACLIINVFDDRMYWAIAFTVLIVAMDGIEEKLPKQNIAGKISDFLVGVVGFISKYSYSFYLGHPIGILIIKSIDDRATTSLPIPLYVVLEFGCFVIMTAVMYFCFEKPFAKLFSSKKS